MLYNERIITVPWALHKDHIFWPTRCGAWARPWPPWPPRPKSWPKQAARAVKVEYEPLPVVTDPIEPP